MQEKHKHKSKLQAKTIRPSLFRLCVLLMFFSFNTTLNAQIRGTDPATGFGTGVPDTVTFLDTLPFTRVPDTVKLIWFYPINPSQEYEFIDSLLNNDFQQYDPSRKGIDDYANLGSMGSAHRPLVYESRFRRGLDVGFHQYDLYQKKPEDFRFFNLQPAYTNLYYSQGTEQNDSDIQANFYRSFDGGLHLGIDYERLIHSLPNPALALNQNVFYPYQGARHTSLSTGLWYKSKNDRYNGFFNYTFNEIQHQDHGGIIPSLTTDTLIQLGNSLQEQYSINVFESTGNAKTRHENRSLNYTQHIRLNRSNDSLKIKNRNFRISHRINYEKRIYKFSDSDSSPTQDTLYYGDFLVDARGLRNYLEVRSIKNDFSISTFRIRRELSNIKQQGDLIEVGISHAYHQVFQEPLDTIINNLYLTGQLNFSPNNRLKIKTAGQLALWNQAGDYRVTGDFFFDFKKAGQLRARILQQLYEPNLIQTRNFITETQVWNNNFRKTLETQVEGTYSKPEWQLELTGRYSLLNNLVYYDSLALPQQADQAISIGQLIIAKDFKLGNFHLDNRVVLQQISGDILRLPSFYTVNSLYVEGRIFKKVMLARFGLDLRMNNTYLADQYFPLTGQFYLQNDRDVKLYPAVDAFFSFKVDRFRAFAKMENLTSFISKDIYYHTPYYPQKEAYFRFGIRWLFLDAKQSAPPTQNPNSSGGRAPTGGGPPTFFGGR